MSDNDQSPAGGANNQEEQPRSEHLNIKVTDNNNEVFFKIKRTTALQKLMNAFCERQGKNLSSVRFLFDGARVNPTDSPDSVSHIVSSSSALPGPTSYTLLSLIILRYCPYLQSSQFKHRALPMTMSQTAFAIPEFLKLTPRFSLL